MAVFDSTTLLLLIEPNAKPPLDPSTNKPLERCQDRLQHLLDQLTVSGARVEIPTPVLSELLVGAGDSRADYLAAITSSAAFAVLPFDVKAAVELACMLDANGKQAKAKRGTMESWAKVKFDRQIAAICKAHGINEIYTDDGNLAAVAKANGITVLHTWDLPLPPQKEQQDLDLGVVDRENERP